MRTRHLIRGSYFIATLLAGMTTASADVMLEYSGSSEACHGEFLRLAMSGARLRVEPPPPIEHQAMLYDGAEKLAVSLDTEHRRYFEFEMDEDALDYQSDVLSSTSSLMDKKLSAALPGGVAAIMGANSSGMADGQGPELSAQMQVMLQKNMEQMPKEQREQMQKALKDWQQQGFVVSRTPPQTEVSDETRTIGGLRCVMQRVTQDGVLLEQACVAQFDALGLQPIELKRLQKSLRNFDGLSTAMSKFRIAGVSMPTPPPIERSGLAIESRCYDQGHETGVTTLRMTRPSLPEAFFEVPAGYQRMDLSDPGAGIR